MLKKIDGDIFNSTHSLIVIPVSTQGRTHNFTSREYKRRYKDTFDEYRNSCKDGNLPIGSLHLSNLKKWVPWNPEYVIHLPVVSDTCPEGDLHGITRSLLKLDKVCHRLQVRDVGISYLLDSQDNDTLEKIIEKIFSKSWVEYTLYNRVVF